MRVIARSTLQDFWTKHAGAEQSLRAWFHDAEQAQWKTPEDAMRVYRNASILGNDRVVFNIRGNQYRLIVAIQYNRGIVFIRFVGTHREYDDVDAETI